MESTQIEEKKEVIIRKYRQNTDMKPISMLLSYRPERQSRGY